MLCVVLGSSLAVFGAWGIVVFGLVVGLAVYVREAEPLWSWTRFAFFMACLLVLAGMLMPAINSAEGVHGHETCVNNLYQIALALQEYHHANGCFPPVYTSDKHGKPMLSWRVLILPYMDCEQVYAMYNLTEPWDGPTNKKASALHLRGFACPSDPITNASDASQTNYVAVVGPNAAWWKDRPRKLADFGGEAAHTIMIVEVADSGISWAEPRDLPLEAIGAADARSLPPPMLSKHGQDDGFLFTYDYSPLVYVAMADGSVRCLPMGDLSPEAQRKILQIGDCSQEEIESLCASYGHGGKAHPNWPNIAALAVWLLSVGTLLIGAMRGRKTLSAPPTPLAG